MTPTDGSTTADWSKASDDDAMLALEQICCEVRQCNLKNPHPTRAGHEVMADLNALIEAIGFDRYDRLMDEINRRQWLAMGLRPAEMRDIVQKAVEDS